jgi:hypothetical protein
MGFKSHIWKKILGLTRVTSWPVGLTGFERIVAPTGLLTNPNRSSSRIDPLGRSKFNNYDERWVWAIRNDGDCLLRIKGTSHPSLEATILSSLSLKKALKIDMKRDKKKGKRERKQWNIWFCFSFLTSFILSKFF